MSDSINKELIEVTKEALAVNKGFLNVMIDHSIKMSQIFAERL